MHYVYELKVGGQPYYGYTSRPPQTRLEEHLKMAESGKWKHKSKLYPLLHELEGDHEFQVLKETTSELEALLFEIAAIRSKGRKNTLNLSNGGEGSTMIVRLKYKDGKLGYTVKSRKRSTKRKTRRNRRRYRR